MTAIRKPPAPSLEDMVRRWMIETAWPPTVRDVLAFVRSIPPINAENNRAEALRAQRDDLRVALSACVSAMRRWGLDEDGIPEGAAFRAYQNARTALAAIGGAHAKEKPCSE